MGAALAAGQAVRLTRDAANRAIHEATPLAAGEGSGIAPKRRASQETRPHRFDQDGAGEGFPLHQSDEAGAGQGELDPKVEPASAGAEADEVQLVGT